MIYNQGWGNLIPQKLKYTAALAAQAAKLLQSGERLTATPAQGLMPPSSETCLKIAKALKEFDGEE